MNKRLKIPFGTIGEEAEYKNQVVDDYKNNPFIEALPNILTKEEAIYSLMSYPSFNTEERNLEPHYRYHIIQRLFQYFQPLDIHIDLESRISRMIRQGYLYRNPLVSQEYKKGIHQGYKMIQDKTLELERNQPLGTTSYGFTIIGVSGMGKSISIQKILSLYPQVIIHSEYKGTPFSQYQVTWMKIDCPHSASLKELCVNFLITIDSILGTDYYKKNLRGNSSSNTLLPVICQIAKVSIGMLVIDEIQSLSLAKSGGAEKMLNFFMTLINTAGVPVVLIGTNKAMSVLQSQFRQARRGSGQGDLIFDRMENKDEISWKLFVEGLFEYQWVRKPCQFNQELSDTLYEESQGIFDIAIKLFIMAQIRAIATNKEEITPNLIRYIAKENLKLVKPMLTALKQGNIAKIAMYEDIAPIDFDEFMGQQLSNINLNSKIKEIQQLKKKNIKVDADIKEQSIIRLLDLDIDPIRAKRYVENILEKNTGQIEIKEVVKKAYKLMIDDEEKKEKQKLKSKEKIKYSDSDLRFIVEQGKKQKITAYDALKAGGYIKAPVGNFLRIG